MQIYNFFLEKLMLPLTEALLGSSLIKQIKQIRKEVVFCEQELTDLQYKRLQNVLRFASQKSIYYSALTIEGAENPIHWLKQFPVLTKQLLAENRDRILTTTNRKLYKHSSSGSTGVQSTVYWSATEQDRHRASQIVWWEWAGYHMGTPLLQTGITPNRGWLKGLKDVFFRTYYLNAFAHSQEESRKALLWAKHQKGPVLGGYASSLYVLARQAGNGSGIKFKSAITWGDKLFDHYRQIIESTFNTKVYETYGAAEGLMIAAQKDLQYMYIMANNIYLELLDDAGNEVEDGQIGHVVVTSLNAFVMPLIRYRIGDLAIRLPRDQYPEKRDLAFPLLQKVIGRDTDLVKTKSGKYMVVHSFTGIFEHVPEISQFCVIQRDLQGIDIEYIPASDFRMEILDHIRNKILEVLKEDFLIAFKQVTEIKPTKSGKPQIIQSFLSKTEL